MTRLALLALTLWVAALCRIVIERHPAWSTPPEMLRAPLSTLSMEVFGPEWKGENVLLDKAVQKKAGVSDYIQRSYRHDRRSFWFYVGFASGWRENAVHHPEVCFPGVGLELERREIVTFPLPGIDTPASFSELLWRDAEGRPIYSLSSFFTNGTFEPSEELLRRSRRRGVRYFAIITLSGPFIGDLEETRRSYHDLFQRGLPDLLKLFP